MSHFIRRAQADRLADESGPLPFRENGPFRVCLVYPNTYAVGMSNLGMQVNHRALAAVPGLTVERAFLPDPEWDTQSPSGKGAVLSMETGRPLTDFDVVAFSLTYELDLLNVVKILIRSGIPPLKESRPSDDGRSRRFPLLMCGGAATTANPAPLEALIDLFWIGESEDWIARVFTQMQEGLGSPDLLENLAKLPHVYVPGINRYKDAYTSTTPFELDRYPAVTRTLTPHTVFSSTGLIEITRGCKWPCRFCIARVLYGKVRMLSRETVLAEAQKLKPYTRKLGLFGAGISDHPDLVPLIDELAGLDFTVTVSSLRIAAMRPALLEALSKAGQRTVTVAPESFSQRILKRMAKGVNHVNLHQGLDELARSSIAKVKCYLLLGIPGEDTTDLALIRETLEPYTRRGKAQWDISFSILEPKPHTPFETFDVPTRAEIEEKIKFLRRDLARLPRARLVLPSHRETYLCDWLCRGDSRVGREVVRHMETTGEETFPFSYSRYLQEMEALRSTGAAPWALTPDGKLMPPPFEPDEAIPHLASMPGPGQVPLPIIAAPSPGVDATKSA